MISINLLPEELRPKKKISYTFPKPNLMFTYIFISILGIHTILFILIIVKSIQSSILNKRWQENKNQLTEVEEWRRQNQKINQEYRQAMEFIQQRINFYPKLKALSKNIVEGIWFRYLDIKSKDLKLEGSVVSTDTAPTSVFKTFCDNLKNDNEFSKDIASFDIGPLKTRRVSGYDILDFTIEIKLR